MPTQKKPKPSGWPRQDRAVSPVRQNIGGTHTKIGRIVTAYNAPMALEMCEEIAGGRTVKEITTPDGPYVTAATFRRWRIQQPELERAFQTARLISAYAFEEESIDMAREIRENPGEAQRVRAFDVALNHLRWVSARRNPHIFSEKAAIKVTVPIQINTGLDLGGSLLAQDVVSKDQSVYHVAATVQREVVDVDAKPLIEGGKAMKRKIPEVLADKERKAREKEAS